MSASQGINLSLTQCEEAFSRLLFHRLSTEEDERLTRFGSVFLGRTAIEREAWQRTKVGDLIVCIATDGPKFVRYACKVAGKDLKRISANVSPEERPFEIKLNILGEASGVQAAGFDLLLSGAFDHPSRGVFQLHWEQCKNVGFGGQPHRKLSRCVDGSISVEIAQTADDMDFVRDVSAEHPFGFRHGLLTLVATERGERAAALVANLSNDSSRDHRAPWRVFRDNYPFVRQSGVFINRIYTKATVQSKWKLHRCLLLKLSELAWNLPSKPLSIIEGVSYDFHPVAVRLGFNAEVPVSLEDSFYYWKPFHFPTGLARGTAWNAESERATHSLIRRRAGHKYWMVTANKRNLSLSLEKSAWALRYNQGNVGRWRLVKPGHLVFLLTEDDFVRAMGSVTGTENRQVRGLEGFPLWIDFQPPMSHPLEIPMERMEVNSFLKSLQRGGINLLPDEFGAALHKMAINQIKKGKMWIDPNPFLLHETQFEVRPNQVFVVMSWRLTDTVFRVLEKILAGAGYKVVHAGHREGQVVFEDIWLMLNESSIVLVDFTDKRPNVYLEYGMALVLGKPIIAITQNQEDIPSDTPNLKYILYKDQLADTALEMQLLRSVKDTVDDIERAKARRAKGH